MKQLATITTKRQLTIPAAIYEEIGLQDVHKVLIQARGNQLIIEPATALVHSLAGSVRIPSKYKGKSVDDIIRIAKKEYFRKKRK